MTDSAPQPGSTTIPLYLHKGVGSLFRILLQMPTDTSLYTVNLDSLPECFSSLLQGRAVTALAATRTGFSDYLASEGDRYHVRLDSNFELYPPTDQFHYAFSLPRFQVSETVDPDFGTPSFQVAPLETEDSMLLWQCSKGRELKRVAPQHVMVVESLLNAVLPAGYFGAVLPKNWLGRKMTFMRWFANAAAPIAKIKLPPEAVYTTKHDSVKSEDRIPVGEWYLYIWTKALDERHASCGMFPHSKFRWASFVHKLADLSEASVEKCFKTFLVSDWYRHSIKLWNELITDGLEHNQKFGAHATYAHLLRDPAEVRILKAGPAAALDFKIAESLAEIKRLPNAVQIKPGPPVKVQAFGKLAECQLLDVLAEAGMEYDPRTEEQRNQFELTLRRGSFSTVKEYLIRTLLGMGLVPMVLRNDAIKIRRQDTWLERQLTPIERTISIPVPEGEPANWERVYEDVGMRATQAANIQQWEERARAMGMDLLCFGFQYSDMPVLACKSGVLNSNTMGLGKTLETLLLAKLRANRKCLIVCPTKLIGEWQEQIEKTLRSWARRQMTNWRLRGKKSKYFGKPKLQGGSADANKVGTEHLIDISYQVIEWAEDCKPNNLKAFNIISYERLSTIPKDAHFFKCPKCDTITCSPRGVHYQVCQNQACVSFKLKAKWKAECRTAKLRKHLYNVMSRKKIYRRLWKQDKIDFAKLEHFCDTHGILFGEPEDWKLLDPRPIKPRPTVLLPQAKRFKKVKQIKLGTEGKYVNGTWVQEPRYDYRPRTPHLKWTFAELLRWSFNMVAIDEALYIKNESTNRAEALWHICGRTRVSLTGTPIRGLPQNILNIINWTVKRSVYPDYRRYDAGAIGRFLDKFGTYVFITGPDGTTTRKLLPKIANPELFQTELSPIMLRHTKHEPEVIQDIPLKVLKFHDSAATGMPPLEMDPEHRKFYQLWLEKFAEWWAEKRREEDKQKGVKVQNNILAKLTYLINASTIPHRMFDKLKTGKDKEGNDADFAAWAAVIGHYKGPMTAKQIQTLKLVKRAKMIGDKVLVASIRRANLHLIHKWCEQNNLYSCVIDGTVSNQIKVGTNRSPRAELITRFRTTDMHVACCGLTALSEGVNIPEANRVVLMDYSWEPSEMKQFIGRMDRPQQTKVMHATALRHLGTIDEYMYLLNALKFYSASEGVDYMEFDLTTEMIPDIKQYADAIVDGNESKLKARMQLAVDELRKKNETGDLDE